MRLTPTSITREAWSAPWKVINECRRWFAYPLARLYARVSGLVWQTGWSWYGLPLLQITRGSQVKIGQRCQLRSFPASNPLSPFHPVVISTRQSSARISIGDDFSMTGGAVVAAEKITIGQRVMVGANSIIIDTDFHPLDAVQRAVSPQAGASKAVEIEDDVFIGTQVLILKGTHIGARTIVGAGSVVQGIFPSDAIVAGNPAHIIRQTRQVASVR